MRVPLRIPALILGLAVLWVALWDDITWANIIGGIAVGALVASVARFDSAEGVTHFHPLHALWYVVRLGLKLLESNIRLAWEILTPGIGTHTGIIAVPMHGGSDGVITTVANSITLTPGTMTVEVTRTDDGVILYIHGMYTKDLDAVRHEMLVIEALALRAFGTREEAERARRDLREHDEAAARRRDEEGR